MDEQDVLGKAAEMVKDLMKEWVLYEDDHYVANGGRLAHIGLKIRALDGLLTDF